MKKVSKVLLTAVLAAAVAGCSGSGSADTSKDHLARIKEAGVLKVGLEGDWQPFSYETADGELVGYDVEVAKGIAEYLGVKIEITPTPWDGLFLAMESDVIDMVVNGVDITEERSKTYDFSDPYAYDHTVLIVRDDNTEIKSFEDLKGKKTANSIGSTYMELGEQYGAEVNGVDTLGETLDLVKNGKVDATINAQSSFEDYMKNEGGPFIVVDEAAGTAYGIPLVKGDDNASLRAEINKALADMRDSGKLAELSVKYFGDDRTNP